MQRSPLQRSATIVIVIVAATVLAACQPTGHPRCDDLTRQRARADSYDYPIRCNATFSGVSNAGRSVLGWTDHDSDIIWLWPNKMTDSRVLRKVAWHEIGHVAWDRQGRSGTQAAEELWADGYSYCSEPIAGVGYSSRPTDCTSYLRR